MTWFLMNMVSGGINRDDDLILLIELDIMYIMYTCLTIIS